MTLIECSRLLGERRTESLVIRGAEGAKETEECMILACSGRLGNFFVEHLPLMYPFVTGPSIYFVVDLRMFGQFCRSVLSESGHKN